MVKKQTYLPKYLFLPEQEQNKIQISNIYIQHTPIEINKTKQKSKPYDLYSCVGGERNKGKGSQSVTHFRENH